MHVTSNNASKAAEKTYLLVLFYNFLQISIELILKYIFRSSANNGKIILWESH